MKKTTRWLIWLLEILAGSALFALGFDLFLEPHDINAGGLSGVAMIVVALVGKGSVGWLTLLFNVPLFLLAGRKVGRKFFVGSLIGSVALSLWMEVFEYLPLPETEPLLGALYGGILCGAGCGLSFLAGASTGGMDIVARLVKLMWRSMSIGKLLLAADAVVVALTALTFRNLTSALYCGIALYVSSQVLDAVVYSFDYSKVALIISPKYEQIVTVVTEKLERGATLLHGEGAFSGQETEVVLVAIKRHQLADLKELVVGIDPNAFIILQDSHQVLGDGFARYSKDSL